MRASTYLGFAAGLLVGACMVSFNPKAKQMVTETKEKIMDKVEDTVMGTEQGTKI